jgi:hypothetical protein
MTRETLNVTLANGTQVPFEEFEKWSAHKQRMHTDHPVRQVKYGLDHSLKMSRIGKAQFAAGMRPKPGHYGAANGQARAVITLQGHYPTLKAAAKAHGITTERINCTTTGRVSFCKRADGRGAASVATW